MTKEELRKEATTTVEWKCTPMIDRLTFVNGYITGAEPREKQIELLGERCNQLLKDKGDLTDKVAELEKLKKENEKLDKQIDTMLEDCKRCAYRKTSERLEQAKEILAKLLEEEKNNMYWEMNGSDKSSYYEVRKQAEQFLKEIEK